MVTRLSLIALTVALAGNGTAFGQLDTLRYEKRATREASRRATLARYMPDLQWTPWHLVGPFDNSGRNKHDVIYPPELTIDLEAGYHGKGGREVAWQPIDDSGFDPIDLARFGSDEANTDSVAYLYREVTSDRAGAVAFEMGSDDGLKLWLNGRLLVDTDAYRGLNIADHLVDLPFDAGLNTLLVKVTQGVGGWQFQMRPQLDGHMLAMLQYRLDEDFPLTPEARHYRAFSVLEPPEVILEVGGLDILPDGRPIVATRRGEIWIIDGAYEEPPFGATFTRFAFGLHEPLGLRVLDDGVYTVQRGELTRLVDVDGDGEADRYETVSDAWGLSGNYHEFGFGPKLDGQGRLWVSLNLGFCGSLGKSIVPWRGWALIVNPDGSLDPVCGGLRSPNGLGANAAGDMFYTDNQGDWVGTNKLAHLDYGDWHGHVSAGENWYATAGFDEPQESDFKPPAVWFPYGRMGQSTSDILLDDTDGAFGPFAGQVFVGDQTNASVMRVALERVAGEYQGACFPFRKGLDSGVNRMCFGHDGSMFVGLTNRGWGSLGRRSWGLQRLVYTGVTPFEIATMEARPDGFELTFTSPVDAGSVTSAGAFSIASFRYLRHQKYGSPEVDRRDCTIVEARVTGPASVRLVVDGLRAGYVHELHATGVRDAAGAGLLHTEAYYTLNAIP